jgi:hypothetical protein
MTCVSAEKLLSQAGDELDGPLERSPSGDYVVDATLLARRFGQRVPVLRELMRRHLVTSRVETGTDDDAGTSRLTVQCGHRVWRAIIDNHGAIVSEEMAVSAAVARPLRRARCK